MGYVGIHWGKVRDRHRDLQTQIAGSLAWVRGYGRHRATTPPTSLVEGDRRRVALLDDSAKLDTTKSAPKTTRLWPCCVCRLLQTSKKARVLSNWGCCTWKDGGGQPTFCTLILLAKVCSTSLQPRGRRRHAMAPRPRSLGHTPGEENQQLLAEQPELLQRQCLVNALPVLDRLCSDGPPTDAWPDFGEAYDDMATIIWSLPTRKPLSSTSMPREGIRTGSLKCVRRWCWISPTRQPKG